MNTTGVRFGLYGAPRVGKTTVVERLIALLQASGVTVGGFVTREIRDGQRIGFACHDLAGRSVPIAHVDWMTGPLVGRYRVDVAAFESVALTALDHATGQQVVIIDEVGAMELLSSAFVQRLGQLLDQPGRLVVTMHSRPHPVTDALRTRGDMQILEVTADNRQSLPGLLCEHLRRGQGSI